MRNICRNYIFNLFYLLLFCVNATFAQNQQFVKGADIGWLSEMESKGQKFYNDVGTQQDCRQILLDHCINSIRLRVWVNPTNGFCGKADVVAAAIKASKMGFRLMIDFHYSDSWADPGQQTKPTAWASYTTAQLIQAIYDHTYSVMDSLAKNGIYPDWVQVGNETNNGMLWEDGRASTSMSNFAKMITSGYNAVKAVSPNSKVVVHLSNGFDNALFRWIFDGLKNNGGKWDVVGMSLYPTTSDWQTLSNQCLTNMNDMVTRYSKEVIISEVGLDQNAPQATYDLLTDLLNKVRSIPNNKGLGIFYWEPECYNWNGYGKGAWGANGRPTIAIDAFSVGCNKMPLVSITSPLNNSIFITPATITINVNASDADGTISKVEFYNGNILMGSDVSSPYSYSWTNVAAGNYTISVKAIDNSGAISTSSSMPITVSNTIEQVLLGTGWNYIGCPLKGSKSLASALSSIWTNVETVKNLDSFYSSINPSAMNSLKNVEWGYGYLIKVNKACTLDWIVR